MTGVGRWNRRKPILLVTSLLAVFLVGCDGPGHGAAPAHTTPMAALENAIAALEKEPNYSLTYTDSPGTPAGRTAVYRVTIEQPDRIAIRGAENVIVIGSAAYSKTPYGWTSLHHRDESANYTNAMLADINILKRATSVNGHGDTYTVPPAEAAALLQTTGLPRFQTASGVTYSATVDSGLIRSVSIHVTAPSPITDTIVVSGVGSSSAVTAPRSLIK